MNSIGKILLYFISVAILGALLAAPLFWGLQSLKPWARDQGYLRFEKKPRQESLSVGKPLENEVMEAKGPLAFLDSDFSKVSNRAMMVAALLLIWPIFRSFRIKKLKDLGLEPDPAREPHFAIGFLSALAAMAALGWLLIHFGVYKIKDSPPWNALWMIGVSAMAVAVVEEWIFRGFFFGLFRKSFPTFIAVILVSGIYAIVHFLKPPEGAIPAAEVTWLSGFTVLADRFHNFYEPSLLLGGFATLFLFGCLLNWAVLQTNSLWLGIGIHAGLVFAKFGFSKLTKRKTRDLLPWVGDDIVVGIAALGTIVVIWILVKILLCYAGSRRLVSI